MVIRHYPFLIEGKKYIIVDGNLIIKNPLKSDNDYYTCVATNTFGTDRTTVETYITRKY